MIAHSKPYLTQQDQNNMHAALQAGQLAKGPACDAFMHACADYLKLSNAYPATSGTAAMMLALKALGIGAGDDVLMPSYVCHEVQNAVQACGAQPVFYDSGDAWNLDVSQVAACVTAASKAIIVVHLYGLCNDIGALKKLKLPIIEDSCQAFTPHHSFEGDMACFSFHATKCLTTGEGGMVSAINPQYHAALNEVCAANPAYTRLSDLQAQLGASQLAQYDSMLARRKEIAARYFDELPQALTEKLRTKRENNMFFRFPLYHAGLEFERVQTLYAQAGIAIRHGVDALLHQGSGLANEGFSVAVDLFQNSFSIPIYPALTQDDISHIIKTTQHIFS